MVLFDTDYLSCVLCKPKGTILDPQTGSPVDRPRERIEHLITTMSSKRERILIPTPVLAEIMVIDAVGGILEYLKGSSSFDVVSFDQIAAIEVSQMLKKIRKNKRGDSGKTWSEIKFDHQIVSVAVARGASAIYSNDKHVSKLGRAAGISVVHVAELPEPPPTQSEFDM